MFWIFEFPLCSNECVLMEISARWCWSSIKSIFIVNCKVIIMKYWNVWLEGGVFVNCFKYWFEMWVNWSVINIFNPFKLEVGFPTLIQYEIVILSVRWRVEWINKIFFIVGKLGNMMISMINMYGKFVKEIQFECLLQ